MPAKYSVFAVPSRLIEHEDYTQYIQVVIAHGALRAIATHARKTRRIVTMPLTYYAADAD